MRIGRIALPPLGGQAGLGAVELMLAGFLGITVIGTGGFMFRNQVHEYLDIREQARIQAGLKLAMQTMTLEISNAGAMLPDPRTSFSAQASRFSFAYVDLSGRTCAAGSTAKVTYRTSTAKQTDRIVEDVTCDGRSLPTRILASAPQGKLSMAFRYYDQGGIATGVAARIKAVDLDISLKTAGPKAGLKTTKTRAQTVRVQCMNL